MKTRIEAFLLALLLAILPLVSASALQATTLCNGMSGEAVKEIQQALIDLGYLKGEADGVFGNKTENAVRKFQKANGLTADGLVGEQTRTLLLKMAAELHQQNTDSTPTPQPETEATPTPTPSPEPTATATPAPTGSSLFGGNYATIRYGDKGARVKALQTGLITLKYLKGTADGNFGKKTKAAVVDFQKAKGL